jgi:DNA-binding GntR family transcriptional regulator
MMRDARRANNVQGIVRSLEVDIVLGHLYPRERLVEEKLATRFNTTRHVVRQALMELEIAGLILREANKGATVREYSPDKVNQLYQMRELLEGQAALMVPLPVTENRLSQLKQICDDHAAGIEKSDMLKVVAANKQFHQVLYRLCGNDFLADTIDEMAKKSNLVRFTSSTDEALLKQARDEHYRILEALGKDDNKKLATICIKHIQPSRLMYLKRREHLC